MKFADQLSDKHKQLEQMKSPKMKQSLPGLKAGGKTGKPMSRRDWEDIMGTRRDTYERRNGAVRRK
ncbi:hypothetical protein [Neobacillus sp. OS1-33]|uniref:hypothetical protein n=1 Tax=Neobacillus sp. OS1-33 TaxID=3070683 RepID=UPI0027E165EF|nr:hypothetical protein [Neobacillus sp. OS1-33]WML28582.1 hypothetical protein RCG22_06830 [Neobacillus sp. OS1-33]